MEIETLLVSDAEAHVLAFAIELQPQKIATLSSQFTQLSFSKN
jgi:hypothetical protein